MRFSLHPQKFLVALGLSLSCSLALCSCQSSTATPAATPSISKEALTALYSDLSSALGQYYKVNLSSFRVIASQKKSFILKISEANSLPDETSLLQTALRQQGAEICYEEASCPSSAIELSSNVIVLPIYQSKVRPMKTKTPSVVVLAELLSPDLTLQRVYDLSGRHLFPLSALSVCHNDSEQREPMV